MKEIRFTVYGRPEPQGDLRVVQPKGSEFSHLIHKNKKLKPWRQQIAGACLDAIAKSNDGLIEDPEPGIPIGMLIRFQFAKPKSASKKVQFKITRPDLDKLIRAILDSLTGIAFVDDAQVVRVAAAKDFGMPESVSVLVYPIDGFEQRVGRVTMQMAMDL